MARKFIPQKSWTASKTGFRNFRREAERCSEFRKHNPFDYEGESIERDLFFNTVHNWIETKYCGKLFYDQGVYYAKDKEGSRWLTARI